MEEQGDGAAGAGASEGRPLREDGYLRVEGAGGGGAGAVRYHAGLGVLLLRAAGRLHALDLTSGLVLQTSRLASQDGVLGVEYVPGADRVFFWDSRGVGARSDYNGVLLLHTALQQPLKASSQSDQLIKIELVLSEAVLLYQCLQSIDILSVEGISEVIRELKHAIDADTPKKGVKAQKWSTVTLELPQASVRLVANGVVTELKSQSRRIPALAIASAVFQRASDLVPGSYRGKEPRALMYSEAVRRETFKRWPHMDYKWALPAQMSQAGFYHQPSSTGDDRAVCFTCTVCLVCWEKSDEPWVEHERHSPNCAFVRGEYTHNVPISVTNATACAVPQPAVSVVSQGNTGNLIASGTSDGKVTVWKFDCGLKQFKYINVSPYDSIFSGILSSDSNKVWTESFEKDQYIYSLKLTAMSFIGLVPEEPYPPVPNDNTDKDNASNRYKPKPALICAVTITRTETTQSNPSIHEDNTSEKNLFNSGADSPSNEFIKAMNDQNDGRSKNKTLFLLTYDIHGSVAASTMTVVQASSGTDSKPGGSKKLTFAVQRPDDSNIYEEIFLQYSDEDTELPPTNLLDEMNVINLQASSSKEIESKLWDPKKIIVTKHFKVYPKHFKFPSSVNIPSSLEHPIALMPELPDMSSGSIQDLLAFKNGWLSKDSEGSNTGTKVTTDQTDSAILQQADGIHYINMNGPLEISDLKWYEGGEGTEKMKVSYGKSGTQASVNNGNSECFDSDNGQEEIVQTCVAIQCLSLPNKLILREDSKVTHLMPTEDGEHLLVVVSSLELETKTEPKRTDEESIEMDLDEICYFMNVKANDPQMGPALQKSTEAYNSYMLLYKVNDQTSTLTLDETPVAFKELQPGEAPIDLCMIPVSKSEESTLAVVGQDGTLRLYSLPDFEFCTEKSIPQSTFMSVTYCTSVDRLSVCTTQGTLYFYALNDGDKDSNDDVDDDELSNLDMDMLQKAPLADGNQPDVAPPVLIANKQELNENDLENLLMLTGLHGTNTSVPYSAVVPGFWCELSPAQRPRSDHQNNKTWRLQNTASTWDEHVLELTLPHSVNLAHVELGFTLHPYQPSQTPPIIQVTLLKQNLHGIGYKKDASNYPRVDSPVFFPLSYQKSADSDIKSLLENPVNSMEYLRAHNAEIIAGPLLLASGLDLTQQSGALTLTSPRLYRAKGKTFLIHIKTLFDPAKDMGRTTKSSDAGAKKAEFIGCDWLHQISITVRASPHTDIPQERQQRIAMLESNNFLCNLFDIAADNSDLEKKKLALDVLTWVVSVRLQRFRMAKIEKGVAKTESGKETPNSVELQQTECMKIVEKNVERLLKNCILCAKRSVAKKCVKILLVTSEGARNVPKPWEVNFDKTLLECVIRCIPLLGACRSPGSMCWLSKLAMHVAGSETLGPVNEECLNLLEQLAKCMEGRSNVYHNLLRARFGLYGLPLERSIFDVEGPVLGKSSATPVTFASVTAGDSPATVINSQPKPDHQLKDLYNLAGDLDGKTAPSSMAWWNQQNGLGVFSAGLCESMALHVTCATASDGTKLEQLGGRQQLSAVSALPGDPTQLWTAVKEGQLKQTHSQESDSLEDGENSSLMECDAQDKQESDEDRLFKEADACGIPWQQLVARPPQHILVVERMHSGARRFIVLDFGHPVQLTDVIIPSCTDLVTLSIEIWLHSEEQDSTKLVFASDISTRNLLLTDIQPQPLCRYMKITTIGRYGMSPMKCKIPLGWFYGELVEISNVQASVNALTALQQDLTCRFRLATGKLTDSLNPYLEQYNGNAAHMMAYLKTPAHIDHKVISAYQECIELQQQLLTVTNVLRNLRNDTDCSDLTLEPGSSDQATSQALLERASTDKLRVMAENLVDVLLYFNCQLSEGKYQEVNSGRCERIVQLLWWSAPRPAAGLATLLARLCGAQPWWGPHLADTLVQTYAIIDAPPIPQDRCLILIIYMARKSLLASSATESGVFEALAERALQAVESGQEPALAACLLVVLAACLDSVPAPTQGWYRWDFVSGGRASAGNSESTTPPSAQQSSMDCKTQRRKLQKKIIHHMQEAARRTVQGSQEDQVPSATTSELDDEQAMLANLFALQGLKDKLLKEKARCKDLLAQRVALLGKRSPSGGSSPGGPGETAAAPDARHLRLITRVLAGRLIHALMQRILTVDNASNSDMLILCAKVVGRLCAVSSGMVGLVHPNTLLELMQHAATLPPWPRHAITCLLQDFVEYDSSDMDTSCGGWVSPSHISSASRPWVATRYETMVSQVKSARNALQQMRAQFTEKDTASSGQTAEYNLPLVIESDDSETEDRLERYYLDTVKKVSNPRAHTAISNSNISVCMDARLESGMEVCGEAGARRLLLTGAGALAAAVHAPGPVAPHPPAPDPHLAVAAAADEQPPFPFQQILQDAFQELAQLFPLQEDCTFVENVVSLWLTLNGSFSAGSSVWAGTSLAPTDRPRIRLTADSVHMLLSSLVVLENVSLRCWILSMQALAMIANLPLQAEGGSQMMGRVILDSENFVPAVVKFVNMSVVSDGAVTGTDSYLGGGSVGAGAEATSALQNVLNRVISGRGPSGAYAAVCCVSQADWRDLTASRAHDLQAVLLRTALSHAHMLTAKHALQTLSLMNVIAHTTSEWMSSKRCTRAESVGDATVTELTLTGILADVMNKDGKQPGGRRTPSGKTVLAQMLQLFRRLVIIPLSVRTSETPAEAGPSSPAPAEESQTDESKATQQQGSPESSTNMEDERKQQVNKVACVADLVLQHKLTVHRLFKSLALCQASVNAMNSGNLEQSSMEPLSVSDELIKVVVVLSDTATHPRLVLTGLLDFLKLKGIWTLSEGLVWFILRTLEKPEALNTFIDMGGIEVITERLASSHYAQLNPRPGLVSSLMNYLKLPPQLINLSTSASGSSKKSQLAPLETQDGLMNFAPLCTISCGNPTAQSAEVLLGGGGGSTGSGACAARRARTAAWSYHFFSADDTWLPLTLTLPYAVQLHEIQLQPHVTSLATCPGAVAIEAGCGNVLAPLGPPQNTAGMVFIRLALAQPIIAQTVQIQLYKPRDSSNVGLLHLRVLGTPAFSSAPAALNSCVNTTGGWVRILNLCAASPRMESRWSAVLSEGTTAACAALLTGGAADAQHAHSVLLAAALASPAVQPSLMRRLLSMDALAHVQAYQSSDGDSNAPINAICELLYQLCTHSDEHTRLRLDTYIGWLTECAKAWVRRSAGRAAPSPSSVYVQCLAEVLWTARERDNNLVESLVTDALFEMLNLWVKDITENTLLKKSLDSVLCSMCYIRPDLFRSMLQVMDVATSSAMEQDTNNDSMEGLTDDGKVSGAGASLDDAVTAVKMTPSQLGTIAACAMSPLATSLLLHSHLPRAIIEAITQFCVCKLQSMNAAATSQCDSQMTDSDKAKDQAMCGHTPGATEPVPLSVMPALVDWVRGLCVDRRLKDWLGGPVGSVFWKPLLLMLCLDSIDRSWQESEILADLEEKTIQLFSALTTCHPANQRLFATTLHHILASHADTAQGGAEGISGFTRALILRLLLSSERATVGVRWAVPQKAPPDCKGVTPGRHPATHRHTLLSLPLHTSVRTLLRDHVAPAVSNSKWPTTSQPTSSGVQRSASDSGLLTTMVAWELSVAAASSAKDKRAKEAKNSSLMKQQQKKRHHCKMVSVNSAQDGSSNDEGLAVGLRVHVEGIEGYVSPSVTLGQLSACAPHLFGPHLTLTLHYANKQEPGPMWEGSGAEAAGAEGGGAVLREFGAVGGLALVAAHLPRPHHTATLPPHHNPPQPDLEWVKLDDAYEDVVELGLSAAGQSAAEDAGCAGVPPHALLALGLLLKLPGYAEALLGEGPRAIHLLRLLLGVTDDEDGRSILTGSNNATASKSLACANWSLGTLPFRVVSSLLESAPRSTDDGRLLRRLLLNVGAVRLLLTCLAVFTHHQPESPPGESQASNGSSSRSKSEDKNQLYWAKGTGFGTGSTQQSWNVEQALVRQRTEEEHVTVLLQVLASYMRPGEQWPPEEQPQPPPEPDAQELPPEFMELVSRSSLVPAICSYLRNDSVLDMSRHIPLYVCVLRGARALWSLRTPALAPALRPLPRLLKQMSRTTHSYASKLKMNRRNSQGKTSVGQRYGSALSGGTELSEEDEGLAALIMDIQATASMMCWSENDDEMSMGGISRSITGVTREARYIEVMKRLQFETFEMMEECTENGYKFTVSYHFEGTVRAAGERSHPARMKRLAQEASTLSTSLPLSYSSSVFVRTDTDRLDIMKVLITGPSDTPYANGCFILDVYFPAEYPAVPMLINLETTGRHSVRFNPNLYNDGKVCLSVLNTWHGRPEEKWNAHTSSFLQVLVSIQSLILVPEPYFNEPGYERSRGTRVGSHASTEYNSNIYQACVRWAMLDHLRSPQPCFKQVIQTHFWIKRNEVMQTIASWITELEGQVGDKRTQKSISLNLMALKRHYMKIQEELAKLPVPPGLEELDEPFTLPAAPAAPPQPPSKPPSPPAAPPPEDMDQDMEKLVSQVLE